MHRQLHNYIDVYLKQIQNFLILVNAQMCLPILSKMNTGMHLRIIYLKRICILRTYGLRIW